MLCKNSNYNAADNNAATALELLVTELQAGVRTYEIEEPTLMQYLDCKGCGKID
jgi:hypothetical protein